MVLPPLDRCHHLLHEDEHLKTDAHWDFGRRGFGGSGKTGLLVNGRFARGRRIMRRKMREKRRGGDHERRRRLDLEARVRRPGLGSTLSFIPHFSESPYCHLRGNCVVVQHGDPVPATW